MNPYNEGMNAMHACLRKPRLILKVLSVEPVIATPRRPMARRRRKLLGNHLPVAIDAPAVRSLLAAAALRTGLGASEPPPV